MFNFNIKSDWILAPEILQKRQYLDEKNNCDLVIEELVDTAILLNEKVVQCNDNKEYQRKTIGIKVSQKAYDLFFNSAFGYRAAYYHSKETGELFNETLIEKLIKELVIEDEKFFHADLLSNTKIWIDEGENSLFDTSCNELWVKKWRQTSRKYSAFERSRLARGTHAPIGQKLQIKSAFLNDKGKIYTPENKINRAEQLHLLGYT